MLERFDTDLHVGCHQSSEDAYRTAIVDLCRAHVRGAPEPRAPGLA